MSSSKVNDLFDRGGGDAPAVERGSALNARQQDRNLARSTCTTRQRSDRLFKISMRTETLEKRQVYPTWPIMPAMLGISRPSSTGTRRCSRKREEIYNSDRPLNPPLCHVPTFLLSGFCLAGTTSFTSLEACAVVGR